jgi:hypothetical protein
MEPLSNDEYSRLSGPVRAYIEALEADAVRAATAPAVTPLATEQYERLPKYGRAYVTALRKQLAQVTHERDKALRELAQGPENSRVYVNGLNVEPDRPLGASPVIIFDIEQAGMGPFVGIISAQFDTEGRKAVEISAGGMADQLVLVPVAYNRFRVELVTRQGR